MPRPSDEWTGETGFIHEVVARTLRAEGLDGEIDAYSCGPPPMIDAVLPVLQMAGVEPEQDLFRQVHAGDEVAGGNLRLKAQQHKLGKVQTMSATQENTASVKSGAAGAAKFAGWDSRKYNYFDPKGRKATHYEDMTVDVQPDPKRYLLQDWIISFADGTPTYDENWTARESSDWHAYRSVDQEWERTHYQRQSTICGMIQNVIENGRRSGAPKRFDPAWVKILQDHLGAYKHAEFGLGTSTMQAQRYGYTQMINNAILTNSSYKLRFAQDLTLYLGEIGLDIDGFDVDAGKKHWLEDPIWQPRAKRSRRSGRHRLPGTVFRHQRGVRAAGGRTVPQRLHHAVGRRAERLHDARRRLGGRRRLRAQPRQCGRAVPHADAG